MKKYIFEAASMLFDLFFCLVIDKTSNLPINLVAITEN